MRSTNTLTVALVGPMGTEHPLVELWRLESLGSCGLLGYYPTVGAARHRIEAEGPGRYWLTTGPGAVLMRLESGHN